MVPSTQRPPLETTKTSQPQPVRNEEQRSHLKNSDGQYHNITTVAMKGTSLKMATRGNIRVIYQRILAKKTVRRKGFRDLQPLSPSLPKPYLFTDSSHINDPSRRIFSTD